MAGREGGLRVPGIIRWPGRVKQGSVLAQPTSQMDLMPTMVEVAGEEIPPDLNLDGKSLLDHLDEDNRAKERIHEFMFHHCGVDIHSMRWNNLGQWCYNYISIEPSKLLVK